MGKKNKGLMIGNPINVDLNFETFWNYFNMLKSYAINMFEWTGLPKTIDARYIELMLFNLGYVCFFKDDVTGMRNTNLPEYLKEDNEPYLCLQCTLGGRFNVYNLPTQYHINTANGYHAERDMSNSVIIYNNYLHQPTMIPIRMYAFRLYSIERTIDVNLSQLKHPFIITAPENQIFSIKQMWQKVTENEPMILADKGFDINQFQVLVTNIQNNTIELNNLKHQYMNEALTFLGINNANTDKRERLITSEVESNYEQIINARDIMLTSRKQACEKINEMFGLNIDVRLRSEEEIKQMMGQNNPDEGQNNPDEGQNKESGDE